MRWRYVCLLFGRMDLWRLTLMASSRARLVILLLLRGMVGSCFVRLGRLLRRVCGGVLLRLLFVR